MSLWSVERIRKRKNEDEEIMFVILLSLHLHWTCQRERVKHHLSFLYGKERVRDQGLILDSRIKVEEKLAFFMYMLSHNASYEKLQLEFQHSGWSFSKYVRKFFAIIPILATRIVKPLNHYETHPKIATDTRFCRFHTSKLFSLSDFFQIVLSSSSYLSPNFLYAELYWCY
uniref:Uncharacterized protein n=1 Tax=Avena sativa TaxID=4498 RepID=A0ACD5VR53_AVESA